MLTYMLEEPGMTDEEYRDNMSVVSSFSVIIYLLIISHRVVFFIAGHVRISFSLWFLINLTV